MAKAKMLWSEDRLTSVRADRVREFTITPSGGRWSVRGWFNANEFFSFGRFDTKEEAQAFLEKLHEEIES